MPDEAVSLTGRKVQSLAEAIRNNIERVIIGKRDIVDRHYERLLSALARLVPQYYGSIGPLIDTEERMFPLGTTILLISATSSLHGGTIERLLDLRMRGAAGHLILTGDPEASVNVETDDLPVHFVRRLANSSLTSHI